MIDSLSYYEIVHKILELDKSITSVTIANLTTGKVLATNYKEEAGAMSLLTRQEAELFTIQSIIRMDSRTTLEHKLGKVLYSITVYENVITASMYLFNHLIIIRRSEDDKNNNNNNDDHPILLLSFEKNANHELIINSKVLPFLKAKAIPQVEQD
jgi:hypothetical protein